ncbi:hypothetical protein HCU64_20850 [Methylobacterium sp. C25]|uniref:hypothetical protein n=1 Tax=Methylobacterium sp. C25 TaxID=2721622 RepID=UPI001F1E3513|nr:hypothetical protein [Methylobacterium sp. C25]MCE4226203.1 hypothetical protein [Methylobacterium sp. C25]
MTKPLALTVFVVDHGGIERDPDVTDFKETDDGRYIVVRGNFWRRATPDLEPAIEIVSWTNSSTHIGH